MKRGGDNNKHSNKTQETTVKGTTDSTTAMWSAPSVSFSYRYAHTVNLLLFNTQNIFCVLVR